MIVGEKDVLTDLLEDHRTFTRPPKPQNSKQNRQQLFTGKTTAAPRLQFFSHHLSQQHHFFHFSPTPES